MLSALLTLLYFVIIALAALIGNAFFWRWLYASSTGQDETQYVRTDDGWRLALHRYRPRGPRRGLPVVLCHGAGSNRYSFDLPGAPSLAEFLRVRGLDVWVAELRGSGMSDKPGLLRSDVPLSWEFEDHLRHDVPAIISSVLRITEAPALHWVGHSMGGMLILAHLGSHLDAPVVSATTLGSPFNFGGLNKYAFRAVPNLHMLLKAKRWLTICPIMPVPFIAKLFTPVGQRLSDRLLALFHGPNIAPEVASKVLGLCSEIVTPSRMWLSLGRFFETEVFGPGDGTEYGAKLEDSPTAILRLGGSRDALAPECTIDMPQATRSTAGDRECTILGKINGCKEDYGHMDLIVGTNVTTEVFPLISAWIEEHDQARISA